jgi:hypothetical protein
MINAHGRGGALLALMILAGACADPVTVAAPTSPTETMASRPAPPAPPPASNCHAVSRPARKYLFDKEVSYPVHDWTRSSRYVLYDDGTFALQYLQSSGSFEYCGTYTEANAIVTFRWLDNQNVGAPWGPATGMLIDEFLSVRYGLIMTLDDFEDAVHRRAE